MENEIEVTKGMNAGKEKELIWTVLIHPMF
jgi:hypothetical protein